MAKSLLDRCNEIESEYDGFIHKGVVHYIQAKMGGLILKHAIYRVLEKCPSIWAEDLPEKLDRLEDIEVTTEMQEEYAELNRNLIVPVDGEDIINIIKYAKEYLFKYSKGNIKIK